MKIKTLRLSLLVLSFVAVLSSIQCASASELGDYIWVDADADGFQDAGESGLAGATVSLKYENGSDVVDTNGNAVVAQTTGTTGYYRFELLPEGDYVLEVSPPQGYSVTKGGLDVDENLDASDSNCIVATDGRIRTLPITLPKGVTLSPGDGSVGHLTADCGFYPKNGSFGAMQIPTASSWVLGLMSLLLSAIVFWRRRRDD